MNEACADRQIQAGPDGRPSGWRRARRRLWIGAVLLGLAGALVWPAQRVFRLSPPVPSNPASSSSPAHPAPSALLIDQTRALWKEMEATLEPCDHAVAEVETTPPSPGERPAAARRALAARDACRRSGLGLLAMRSPPAADGHQRDAFNEALMRCQSLYVVEGNSHGRLAEALRTGAQGAASFEAWADVQEANIDAKGCRIGLVMAARQAGLPSSLFETAAPIKSTPTTSPTPRPHA